MKHELGEIYVWHETRFSRPIKTKIVLCIPPLVSARKDPNDCQWIGSKDDYFLEMLNERIYDQWTYGVSISASEYFSDPQDKAMHSRRYRELSKPIIIRPKELYERNESYVKPEKVVSKSVEKRIEIQKAEIKKEEKKSPRPRVMAKKGK